MMRVLTIAREFGSGGSVIARHVADRLKWRLLDREIIDEVVRIAGVERAAVEGCDERADSRFHRVLRNLWQGGFETAAGGSGTTVFDSESMSRCARTVIESAAEAGNCVIVGRGAQCILAHRDDTVNVFLWAPRVWRIRRLRPRLPGEKDLESLMTRMDRARGDFIRHEFDRDWCDYKLYDMMINSALGDEVAAECIIAAIRGESAAHG